MAEVVSSQPVTMEAQVHSQASQYGICGGQSGSGTGFSLEHDFCGLLDKSLSIVHIIDLVG
jgi:hypothetical protein